MMHSRHKQRASKDRRLRSRFRALCFERFEDRRLLSVAPAIIDLAETPVRFRMEVTDTTGSPIRAVEAGKEFAVNIYVVDQRSIPQGVFAAYLDVLFDDSRVERSGDVTFGESYTNAFARGGAAPGILDEVGAVASLFESGRETAAIADSLLFRAPFRAIEAGPVTFLTKPADRLPDSYVLLFGVNQPIKQGQIAFESVSLDITKSPASAFSSTIERPATEFISIPASSLSSERSALGEANAFPWLDTTNSIPARTPLIATSLPILSTFNRGLERGGERWRLLEQSPAERALPGGAFKYTPQNSENESGWIELPVPPAPLWRPLPLSTTSDRESALPTSEDRRHEISSFNTHTRELTWQIVPLDFRQPGWTRAFLRMSWSTRATSLCSNDLLVAQMIDIDEILAGGARLELPESNLDEFFAEEFDDESSNVLSDYRTELLRGDIQLRAARSASLAIVVGMASSKPSVSEHSNVPAANADAEQDDIVVPPALEASSDEASAPPV